MATCVILAIAIFLVADLVAQHRQNSAHLKEDILFWIAIGYYSRWLWVGLGLVSVLWFVVSRLIG